MSTSPTSGAPGIRWKVTRELEPLLEPTFLLPAAGLLAVVLTYYGVVWGSVQAFTVAIDHCAEPLCDFQRYYYPMGREIFSSKSPVTGFYYSPFFALLLAPFAVLGLDAAILAWGGAQLMLILCLAVLPVLLGIRRHGFLLLHLALVLTAFPVLHNLKWGQVSTLLVVALLFGLVLYRRERRALGALCFALAAAIKFYPALFLGLFVLKRDLRTLMLASGFVLFLLVALPSLALGVDSTIEFYRILFETLGIARESMVQDTNSQYLASVVARLAGYVGYDDGWVSGPLLPIVGYLVGAVNIVLAYGVLRLDPDQGSIWAMVLLFLTLPLVVPTSWPHYFVYLPFCQIFLLQRVGVQAFSRTHKAVVTGLSVVPSMVCSSVLIAEAAGGGEVYGFLAVPFVANLLLLPGCYLVLGAPVVRKAVGRTSRVPA